MTTSLAAEPFATAPLMSAAELQSPALDPATISIADIRDPALRPIAIKLLARERLSATDGMALFETRDLHSLGMLAGSVRLARHGRNAFYNINRHINYSNICALSCKFCEFHRKRGEEGAYEYSAEKIFEMADQAALAGATELHIVGGLHPWLPFNWYTDLLTPGRLALAR